MKYGQRIFLNNTRHRNVEFLFFCFLSDLWQGLVIVLFVVADKPPPLQAGVALPQEVLPDGFQLR